MVKKVILIVGILMFFSMVSALFDIGDVGYDITKDYGKFDFIKGWINLSFDNQDSDSLFSTNKGGSITLINLLELNEGLEGDYSCIPSNCEWTYNASDSQTVKNIELSGVGDYGIIGLRFSGGIVESIDSFSLEIAGTSIVSPIPQLEINILNNNEVEWKSHASSGNFGSANYGCFESDEATEDTGITNTQYCNKINISSTPNVKLGANIITNIVPAQEVEYDLSIEGEGIYGDCIASATETGEITCSPDDFMIDEEEELILCIRANDNADADKYKIGYEQNQACGFAGGYDYDFDLFVKKEMYGSFSDFILNNTELENSGNNINIEDYILTYLGDTYDYDCSDECLVPIKFTSKIDEMSLTLSNLDYSYTAGGLSKPNNNEIYDLISSPAKVSSDFMQINLDDAKFTPVQNPSDSSFGQTNFILSFDGDSIFSETINIQKSPEIKTITPRTTASAIPTEFETLINSYGKQITEYKWDFGDETSIQETSTNKATHTYASSGNYNITLTVKDTDLFISSKTFNITVSIPSEAVADLIEKKSSDLDVIKNQINGLQGFYKTSLQNLLNLTNQEANLYVIEQEYELVSNDTTEEEYIDLIEGLLEINIPENIEVIQMADNVNFPLNKDKIDLIIVQEIAGGSIGNSENSLDSILMWNQRNLETRLSFNLISGQYNGVETPLIKIFTLDISEKNILQDNYYLVLQGLSDLSFEGSYSEVSINNYDYINLYNSNKKIIFSTTEDVGFIDLPIFISPGLNQLSIIDSGNSKSNAGISSGLIIFFILILGVVIYIMFRRWYKNKYENHLFKDKNHLFNMAHFINNSKTKGMDKEEISRKLKQSKWSNAQVDYAMKKYSGKGPGMFEIPVNKILRMFRLKK